MNRFLLIILMLSAMSCTLTQEKKEYSNPILAGFYPDPSICRVGSDFYLVNSTFSYFPGIPIFHSKDLTSWKLVGYVLDRIAQLNLDGLGVSRGIFAPAIRYNKGIFYVTCTLVDRGGNFIVTSNTPEGPWSNPIWLSEINGIDPSMFFDENGKAYIVYNSIPPDDKSLYEGHRTLRMYEYDLQYHKVIGEEKILVNGGVDISKKPVWIEGPHIFQKDGYYYLIAAEGGTSEQHSEVVFRSKEVSGPYEPFTQNPILTQRHLNPERKNPITSTGHADFVQTEAGDWWAVFLGCRPYEGEYYNTGRETFLALVTWENGWPVINYGRDEVQYHYAYPMQPSVTAAAGIQYNGNVKTRDDFSIEELNKNWMFLRTPKEQWYDLRQKPGFLSMRLRQESCAGTGNPDFLGHRQQNLFGSGSIAVNFSPVAENEKAGLLIFQNENHFYFLCKSLQGRESVIQLYKSVDSEYSKNSMELMTSYIIKTDQRDKEIYLKIEAKGNSYSFSYSFIPDQWSLLKDSVDAKYLSTKVAGGFVGCFYALYATSLGKPSNNEAYFDWFQYIGEDEIYMHR
jgi:xylan 1,4-beta-xylosidase